MRERLTSPYIILHSLILLIFSVITLGSANGQFVRSRKVEKLPTFTYYTLDGKKYSDKDLKSNSRLMIVYFNPHCEVCQREMTEIVTNMEYFENVQIVLISPNNKEEIMNFVDNYKLKDYPHVTILHDMNDVFYKEFHAIGYPSLYLYDEDKTLIEHFDSHAEIKAIKSAFDPETAKK